VTVPISTILLLLPPDEATLALGRYDALIKSTPAYRMEMTLSSPRLPFTYQITLATSKTGRTRFTAKHLGFDFSLIQTERGRQDLDHVERIYDDLDVPLGSRLFGSRLTKELDTSFPSFVLSHSSRDWFAKGAPLKYERKDGRDIVSSITDTSDLKATFLPSGQLVSLYAKLTQMGQVQIRDYKVSLWKPIPNELSQFYSPLPDGYSPVTTPDAGDPAGVGAKARLGVVQRDGKSVDLDAIARKSGVLVVFADPNGPGSAKLGQALAKLRTGGVPVVRLVDAANAPTGWAKDAKGEFLRYVNPPASPFLILVDKKGQVVKTWLGFGADSTSGFVTEMNTALAELK